MIPYSQVTGTFYTASGLARSNEQITFMPLSTPYAVDGEIVLSTPQIATLDSLGRLNDGGGNLWYRLAHGFYRVVVSDTDAFFISVPDDGDTYAIDMLATDLGSTPSGLQRSVASRDVFAATVDSPTIVRSLRGPPSGFTRFVFVGETGDMSADTVLNYFGSGMNAFVYAVLGNANPGGNPGNFDARFAPYSDWINDNFLYAPASEDWAYNGSVSAVMTYTKAASARYYRQIFGTSVPIEFFVISSDDLEPDGNTVSSTQGAWLQAQLANSTARWKIVLFRDTPFSSVLGAGKAALDWPFAAWGAHAVIAAGPKVMERITLSGNIPLFVTGCGGTGTKGTFGTPLSNSQYRLTDVRAALELSAADDKLVFHIVGVASGEIYHTYSIQGAENRLLSFSVTPEYNSGLRVGGFTQSLELEPYGVAELMYSFSAQIQRLLEKTVGGIIRTDTVPSAGAATVNPWLKNCIIMVGDDPARYYTWNKAVGDFALMRADTYNGTSVHNGSRTQLNFPGLTPGPGGSPAFGTRVSHGDTSAEIWVSINGQDFYEKSDWVTNPLILFPTQMQGESIYVAVFARKAGSIDSEIFGGRFLVR